MKTCDHPLRDGPCQLGPGHRGRHTTVTFSCDACGKRRAGVPAGYGQDGEYPSGLAFCFLCVRGKTVKPTPIERRFI